MYNIDPNRYLNVDPGDLTQAKLVKKSLNCKPFKYFLDQVAPDMAERYSFYDPGVFASGAIQSMADRGICIGKNQSDQSKLGLFKCDQNLASPKTSQNFELSWHRHIKMNNHKDGYNCIKDGKLEFSDCLFEFGNQLWFYDLVSEDIGAALVLSDRLILKLNSRILIKSSTYQRRTASLRFMQPAQ